MTKRTAAPSSDDGNLPVNETAAAARARLIKAIEEKLDAKKVEQRKERKFQPYPMGIFVMDIIEVGEAFGNYGTFKFVVYTATDLDSGEVLHPEEDCISVIPRGNADDFSRRMVGNKYLVNYAGKVEDGGIHRHDLTIVDL